MSYFKKTEPKKTGKDYILNVLKATSSLFVPLLESDVDLMNYSEKLYEKAYLLERFNKEDQLSGYVFYYLNDDFIFITLICALDKGVGSILIDEIKRIAEVNELMKIELEVDVQNVNALKFYSKHSFRVGSPTKIITSGKKKLEYILR